tara:strand:+ start:723 stop:1496 length:774 start_codon:yes stop_codon:yes gene_type:complete
MVLKKKIMNQKLIRQSFILIISVSIIGLFIFFVGKEFQKKETTKSENMSAKSLNIDYGKNGQDLQLFDQRLSRKNNPKRINTKLRFGANKKKLSGNLVGLGGSRRRPSEKYTPEKNYKPFSYEDGMTKGLDFTFRNYSGKNELPRINLNPKTNKKIFGLRNKNNVKTSKYNKFATKNNTISDNSSDFIFFKSKICNAKEQHSLLDETIDSCQVYCSRTENCLAFHYDYTNGSCLTFASCADLKESTKESEIYIKKTN